MPSPDAGTSPSSGQLPSLVPGATPGSGLRPALHPVVVGADHPASPAAGANALVLLQALRRRWLLALVVALPCAAAGAAAAWLLLPPSKYVVQTTLEVPVNPPGIVGQPLGGVDFNTLQRRVQGKVRSRAVLDKVLRDPTVEQLPLVQALEPEARARWIGRELRADFSRGPELFRITLGGDDPEDLIVLLDVFTDIFLREFINWDKTEKVRLIEQQRTAFNDKSGLLQTRQNAYLTLAKTVGGEKFAEDKHRMALEELRRFRTEQFDVQREIRERKGQLTVLQAKEKNVLFMTVPEEDLEAQIDQAPEVRQLLGRIADLDEVLAASRQGFKAPVFEARHAKEIVARKQAEQDLKDARGKARKAAEERIKAQARSRLKADVAEVVGILAQLTEQDNQVKNEIANLSRIPDDIRMESATAKALQIEITQLERAVQSIAEKMERLKEEHEADPRVRLFEPAGIVEMKDDLKQVKMAGAGAAGGFLLALLAVAFWEFRCQRISSVDQVVRGLEMTVMGTLPPLGSRARRLGNRGGRPDVLGHTLLTESIDATRTMLLHAARVRSLHVVMVTSASSGEGKTSVSCHLAASLARAGRKTLLVDCDLRSPAAHRLFNLDLGPGFSDLLRGEAEVADVTRPSGVAGLSVIPAGRGDARALQSLARDNLRALFDRLSAHYDFIIVDSAPVLPVADSLLIGQHVDAVLVSLLSGVSTVPKVHTATQRLTMLGINLLGAVVNGADSELYGYGDRLISASA